MINRNIETAKTVFLVVHNNREKRSYIVDTLKECGFTNVEQVEDGAAAFHVLKRRPIDCVISAWDMPQMNGLTFLRVISADEDLYNIPFIIIATNISRETVIEAGKYGVTSILLEPLAKDALQKKINSVLKMRMGEKTDAAEDFFKKAKKLTDEGKYDEALLLYKRMLEAYEDAEVYYNIGYIKTAQQKYDEALIAFRRAVMINGFYARAYKKMGEVHLKKGDPEKAEEYFTKAGDIFLEREMDNEAEEAYKEVLKINPDTTNVYNSLGILYRKQGKLEEAVKQYNMAIKVDPEDENILYNMGRALLDAERIDDARNAFTKALERNPDFTEAKSMLQAIDLGFK
ncbi:MAG: tetratricopeptide repeat protein [Nitrospinota bacterium]